MNLARPFKAGKRPSRIRVALATPENCAQFNRRYATTVFNAFAPALKGRAKFMPTLRVEST
jgi:hypothetical protein